jgi:hypothetical protein
LGVSASEKEYSSLKDFYIGTKVDSKAICECGQATADKIMTDEEQTITLAMMQGDPNAARSLGDKHDELMDKIAQMTKGCKGK